MQFQLQKNQRYEEKNREKCKGDKSHKKKRVQFANKRDLRKNK